MNTLDKYKGSLLFSAIGDSLGYPVVLKIPDGSFSIGVEKAENLEQLQTTAESLFK